MTTVLFSQNLNFKLMFLLNEVFVECTLHTVEHNSSKSFETDVKNCHAALCDVSSIRETLLIVSHRLSISHTAQQQKQAQKRILTCRQGAVDRLTNSSFIHFVKRSFFCTLDSFSLNVWHINKGVAFCADGFEWKLLTQRIW